MMILGLFKLDIKNLSKIKNKVIVATHPSFIDIVILIAFIPRSTCFVKKELAHNPILKNLVNSIFITNEVELEETPRLYASRVERQDQTNGYIKVCSLNFPVNISDVDYNKAKIIEEIKNAFENEAKIIVLPELCLSSYSCGDLFFSDTLIKKVIKAIDEIMENTKDIEAFYTFGAPLIFQDKLYNCAICAYKGKILGVVPKTYVPNYNEFYEKRYFEGYESQYMLTEFK